MKNISSTISLTSPSSSSLISLSSETTSTSPKKTTSTPESPQRKRPQEKTRRSFSVLSMFRNSENKEEKKKEDKDTDKNKKILRSKSYEPQSPKPENSSSPQIKFSGWRSSNQPKTTNFEIRYEQATRVLISGDASQAQRILIRLSAMTSQTTLDQTIIDNAGQLLKFIDEALQNKPATKNIIRLINYLREKDLENAAIAFKSLSENHQKLFLAPNLITQHLPKDYEPMPELYSEEEDVESKDLRPGVALENENSTVFNLHYLENIFTPKSTPIKPKSSLTTNSDTPPKLESSSSSSFPYSPTPKPTTIDFSKSQSQSSSASLDKTTKPEKDIEEKSKQKTEEFDNKAAEESFLKAIKHYENKKYMLASLCATHAVDHGITKAVFVMVHSASELYKELCDIGFLRISSQYIPLIVDCGIKNYGKNNQVAYQFFKLLEKFEEVPLDLRGHTKYNQGLEYLKQYESKKNSDQIQDQLMPIRRDISSPKSQNKNHDENKRIQEQNKENKVPIRISRTPSPKKIIKISTTQKTPTKEVDKMPQIKEGDEASSPASSPATSARPLATSALNNKPTSVQTQK